MNLLEEIFGIKAKGVAIDNLIQDKNNIIKELPIFQWEKAGKIWEFYYGSHYLVELLSKKRGPSACNLMALEYANESLRKYVSHLGYGS